jgi:hypothetical protein
MIMAVSNRPVFGMRFLVLLLAAVLACPSFAHAETEVDLELVLAVDVSRSMDFDELRLQRDGYIAAFRHPDVLQAIRSGPLGRIALTYVEWAGPDSQSAVIPWTLIDNDAAARAFADRLSSAPVSRYTGTSISGGLLFAAARFAEKGFAGVRKVIDVSGDGPNNRGLPVHPISTGIARSGITINGLPLVAKVPAAPYSIANLDIYYEDCVIGGPGAFLIAVRDMSQLAVAIRRKLMLEIAGWLPQPVQASGADGQRIDCMIGERLMDRWFDNR